MLRRKVARRRRIKEELHGAMHDILEAEPETAKKLEEAARDLATEHGLPWPPSCSAEPVSPNSNPILHVFEELTQQGGKKRVSRRQLCRETGLGVEELEKAIEPLEGEFLVRSGEKRSGRPTIWFETVK